MTAPVPASREDAATSVMAALAEACPEGEVRLIGSMATSAGPDAFSDIDVRWAIPPGQASEQLQALRLTLERVAEVESLRVDPEVRPDSCLVFVRFEGWPLWWRVDLEIHATGLRTTDVRGADPWSPAESACMGVIVTVKALARNRPEAAEDLMARALRRVDGTDVAGSWPVRIASLLDHLESSSPSTAALVSRTRHLVREVLGGESGRGADDSDRGLPD
ncbi:hypothetical protein [Nocardioides panacihumi]